MIAAAAQRTERVRLGAAAHLVPYHQPANLAYRLMWLDHMTGGRYIAGFAPGSYPTDAAVFGTGTNNVEMMVEGLDIIEAVWKRECCSGSRASTGPARCRRTPSSGRGRT